MISIDIDEELSAKQAKELSVSLNLFIKSTEKILLSECYKNKGLAQFKIEFDNGNKFRIIAQIDSWGKIQTYVEYENRRGQLLSEISLQDALNINKYVREFEMMIKHNDINNQTFRGYYTEQDINKKIAIYNKNDVKQRYSERNEKSYFTTINEDYDKDDISSDELEIDDDYER